MSSCLTKLPAFSGLFPPQITYKRLSGSELEILSDLIEFDGEIEKLVSQLKLPLGFFRIKSVSDSVFYFIKVLPKQSVDHLIFSNELAHYLYAKGLECNLMCSGYPVIKNQYCISKYPFLNGRYNNGTPEDANSLGLSIGHMHLALSEYPNHKEIKRNKDKRFNCFRKLLNAVLSHRKVIPWLSNDQLELLSKYIGLLDKLEDNCQVIHGDLNFGNIIYVDNRQNPLILDYENTYYSYLPPLFDLAMLTERFFVVSKDDEISYNLASEFFKSYWSICKKKLPVHKDLSLKEAMQASSIRSLLVLIEKENSGNYVPISEVKKFFLLLKQAEERSNLLTELDLLYRK